jgi:hypothetical protein
MAQHITAFRFMIFAIQGQLGYEGYVAKAKEAGKFVYSLAQFNSSAKFYKE